MLNKVYVFIRHGEKSREFSSVDELNEFLSSIKYSPYEDKGELITIIGKGKTAIYVDDPIIFFDLKKYGYNDASNLELLDWNNNILVIDNDIPAFYSLSKDDNGRYKSRKLAITTEETNTGYFKRRVRIEGKKVSITKLIHKKG